MKIGLVGANITQDELIGYQDEYELWSLNNIYGAFPDIRWAAWFELHVIERRLGTYYRRGMPNYPISGEQTVEEYLKAIDALDCPVFMQKRWKIIKDSRVFPFKRIMDKYGSYMGCSFAWMLPYAMDIEVEEVGYFGISLTGNEYYYQRPSVEYLMGRAEERGIKQFIHKSSDLLQANYIYAYKEDFDQIYMLHGSFTRDISLTILTAIQDKLNGFYED